MRTLLPRTIIDRVSDHVNSLILNSVHPSFKVKATLVLEKKCDLGYRLCTLLGNEDEADPGN